MDAVSAHNIEVALHSSWSPPWMHSDSTLIPASPCSVASFSMYLIFLNQSNRQMVGRDGKVGRYSISVEEGMALEERVETGWVLEMMQGQGSVFFSDGKFHDKHTF